MPSACKTPRQTSNQAGFALVLTLIVIVVLSLLTEAMTRWVSSALDGAFAYRQQVEAERKLAEAETLTVYLYLTRPRSFRGIELLNATQLRPVRPDSPAAPTPLGENYLRLDNHFYRLGDVVLRLQDARGLINLNFGSADDLFALLGLFGVPVEDRAGLIAKLQDYIDPDSLSRLNGAETRQYEETGMDPPTNASLRTPWEVRRILDWGKVKGIAAEDTKWATLTSTEPVTGFNVNTAPRELLSLMPWMTQEAVDNVVNWRATQPITSNWQFGLLTGIRVPEGPGSFSSFPSQSVILTLTARDWPLERRIALRETPQSRDRPWAIDYDVEVPRATRNDKDPDPDEFPLSAVLSPAP
jgi:general secretion pathway protein K